MLYKLKIMLGIAANETDQDERLNLIISGATARLQRRLGGIEPPEEMQDIILDLSLKRFNRIGAEGMSSHAVEGESYTFTDDDLKEYEQDIQDFLEAQNGSKRGKVRFI